MHEPSLMKGVAQTLCGHGAKLTIPSPAPSTAVHRWPPCTQLSPSRHRGGPVTADQQAKEGGCREDPPRKPGPMSAAGEGRAWGSGSPAMAFSGSAGHVPAICEFGDSHVSGLLSTRVPTEAPTETVRWFAQGHLACPSLPVPRPCVLLSFAHSGPGPQHPGRPGAQTQREAAFWDRARTRSSPGRRCSMKCQGLIRTSLTGCQGPGRRLPTPHPRTDSGAVQ